MHVVTLTSSLDTGAAFGLLNPGDWLVQNQNAFELAMLANRGSVTLNKYDRSYFYPDRQRSLNAHPRSLLIVRSGAIGDLLLMTPAVASLKKALPETDIYLCCREQHHLLFSNTELFKAIISYPVRLEMVKQFDDIVSLEDVLELGNDAHATDCFAQKLGVTVDDYKPIFSLTEEERVSASVMMSGKRPKVCIQPMASTKNRDYPLSQMAKVMVELENRGWEVFILGLPGQIPPLPRELNRTFIHDLSRNGLSIRETAAIMSYCNVFLGVDSALIHLCHALDIPAIGLYGPFHWGTRTSKAPLTYSLMGTGECANCRWHAKIGQHFPDMPCRKTQQCSVLASITPERIISKVDALKP